MLAKLIAFILQTIVTIGAVALFITVVIAGFGGGPLVGIVVFVIAGLVIVIPAWMICGKLSDMARIY